MWWTKVIFTRILTVFLGLLFLIIIRVLFLWGLSPQAPALPHRPGGMSPQSSATEVGVAVLIGWRILFTLIWVLIRHHKLILRPAERNLLR